MYLVVGLGNPGKQYEATRHNMGFDTIDVLVERHKIPQGGVKFNAMYGQSIIGGEKAILMKPLSYMNLSGGPIQEMSMETEGPWSQQRVFSEASAAEGFAEPADRPAPTEGRRRALGRRAREIVDEIVERRGLKKE